MDRLISEQAIINILMDNDLDHIQIKDGTELIQLVQAIPSAEPSGDLISRQAAIKSIEERAKQIKNEDTLNGLAGAVGILFELPSVKPQEPTGHWIYDRTRDWDGECKYECSECGMGSDVDYDYCMRCGCRMVEPQEGVNE